MLFREVNASFAVGNTGGSIAIVTRIICFLHRLSMEVADRRH
jgi:hypothetical protein